MSSRRLIQERLAEAAVQLDRRSSTAAGLSGTTQLTVLAQPCAPRLTSMLQLQGVSQQAASGAWPLHGYPQTSILQAWRQRAARQPASAALCRALHSHPDTPRNPLPLLAARRHVAGGISSACLGRTRSRAAAMDRPNGQVITAVAWTKEHSTAAYPPHLRGGQPGGQAGQALGRSSMTSALAERLDAAPGLAPAGRAANGREAPDGWLRAAEPASQEEASHADRVRTPTKPWQSWPYTSHTFTCDLQSYPDSMR